MLSKLLKKDLKRDMRWMWILFVSTIIVACVTYGCKEAGEHILFFKILAIFFESVLYSLLVNVILQPFLRSFLNFTKSLYGEEAYLTHTLPVTKNQIITSKFLTAIIEIVLGFLCLIISLFIAFYSPTLFDTLRLLISTIVVGKFSLFVVISLFVLLVIVEFLMFISLIFYSIVVSYRSKEKRVLKTFLLTAGLSFIACTILSVVLVGVLSFYGIKLTTTTLILSSSAFLGVMLSGIIVYSVIIVLFYFITKKEFNKGVNVD